MLRLLETFALEEVTDAVEQAVQSGTIRFDAVRHLLLCRIEGRPPRPAWRTIPTCRCPRCAPPRLPAI